MRARSLRLKIASSRPTATCIAWPVGTGGVPLSSRRRAFASFPADHHPAQPLADGSDRNGGGLERSEGLNGRTHGGMDVRDGLAGRSRLWRRLEPGRGDFALGFLRFDDRPNRLGQLHKPDADLDVVDSSARYFREEHLLRFPSGFKLRAVATPRCRHAVVLHTFLRPTSEMPKSWESLLIGVVQTGS